MAECWLAQFDPLERECLRRADGQLDPCHLISQQRLRAAGIDDLWDGRLIVPGCRRHHDQLDRPAINPIRLDRGDYPPKLLAWVQQHGWHWDELRNRWAPPASSHGRAA